MNDTNDWLNELSNAVMESARDTAFALMKANHTEIHAPESPTGTLRGLTPQSRDIAIRLRESIWTRFDSLRFHFRLIVSGRDQHVQRFREQGPHPDPLFATRGAFYQAQYLFDDLVFNAASLFDYVGNAIWFGFHGQNHIKRKWGKVIDAARNPGFEARMPRSSHIFGSETARVSLEANSKFVNALYGYRSDLIHVRIDRHRGKIVQKFTASTWDPDLVFHLPADYARRLKAVLPEGDSIDMVTGAEALIRSVGDTTIAILAVLRNDLGWSRDDPITIFTSGGA